MKNKKHLDESAPAQLSERANRLLERFRGIHPSNRNPWLAMLHARVRDKLISRAEFVREINEFATGSQVRVRA